ncbi:pyocin knob domain-containing protein [Aquamicrobium sp. LC103]|uniref:pyocin knob domain-containing protein n=1 Tax=Aquamicrobium sp. LC103 TaxID=1120658 RepID=UPI000699A27A|nr:pyocin knob domain-containing protein [Aquamicrobium sp. LC103]TKT78440.1 hypothetical protein XW59_012555 [Aquamicrobium sp. LC103]
MSAPLSYYTAGTISIAANGTTVTGTGTAWLTAGFQEGDQLFANGFLGIVLSVQSNTSLLLAQPWRGGALSNASYYLMYLNEGSRASAQARLLIDLLGGSGNLQALAGLTGAANRLPFFTGAGTMDTTALTPFMRTLLDDANGAAAYGTLGTIPDGSLPGRISEICPLVSNLNDIATSGWARAPGGTTGNPHSGVVVVFTLVYSATARRQFAYAMGAFSWSRAMNSGTWTAWVRDDPPERGSNANGEYVRFADGTQICWNVVRTAIPEGHTQLSANLYYSNWQAVTFPVGFSVAPAVTQLVFRNAPDYSTPFAFSRQVNTTSCGLVTATTANSVTVGYVQSYSAIGRWY